ncbi:orotidine-5'-phosphate decarboxylase [Holzapfeliella sp. He02]|uniref:Orotidine 5'-phosphate decarboxylase n=1 Tax=Holzapfeliella saturejae TaxID=3082953 RepID=A0ABU8SHW7_9LACO
MTKIMIAMDFQNQSQALDFLRPFEAHPEDLPILKIGMELFYKEGADLVRQLRQKGFEIFLDLKLHDIPHTVEQAMKQIQVLDVQFVTIHALGGSKMVESARNGLGRKTHLLAVTQLTSTSSEQLKSEQLVNAPLRENVVHLAEMAFRSGADGVVSSAQETPTIKAKVSKDCLSVTPGIRLKNTAQDDQVRITTPLEAQALGSDYLVIGRSITQSAEPFETYQLIKRELGA